MPDSSVTLPQPQVDASAAGAEVRRVALVTGAGKRLGRHIALTLAQQGWDVAVHYRTSRDEAEATADEIRSLGRQAVVLSADLSDEAAARALPVLAGQFQFETMDRQLAGGPSVNP